MNAFFGSSQYLNSLDCLAHSNHIKSLGQARQIYLKGDVCFDLNLEEFAALKIHHTKHT